MDTQFSQAFHMLNSTQITGVHNVGAVFIFERGHKFTRTVFLFQQDNCIAWRTNPESRLNLDRDRFLLVHDLAHIILFAFMHVVFPTAGIGTGTLIRVAFVQIAG